MLSFIRTCSNALYYYGKGLEGAFRQMKHLPQYKYLTIPVYKACVQKIGVIAATAVSFLSADLVVHQLLPQVSSCLMNYALSSMSQEGQVERCAVSYSYGKTEGWMAQAGAVMYAKYCDSK